MSKESAVCITHEYEKASTSTPNQSQKIAVCATSKIVQKQRRLKVYALTTVVSGGFIDNHVRATGVNGTGYSAKWRVATERQFARLLIQSVTVTKTDFGKLVMFKPTSLYNQDEKKPILSSRLMTAIYDST
jgi:hypothetical protein